MSGSLFFYHFIAEQSCEFLTTTARLFFCQEGGMYGEATHVG
jgi:hypothetical protein